MSFYINDQEDEDFRARLHRTFDGLTFDRPTSTSTITTPTTNSPKFSPQLHYSVPAPPQEPPLLTTTNEFAQLNPSSYSSSLVSINPHYGTLQDNLTEIHASLSTSHLHPPRSSRNLSSLPALRLRSQHQTQSFHNVVTQQRPPPTLITEISPTLITSQTSPSHTVITPEGLHTPSFYTDNRLSHLQTPLFHTNNTSSQTFYSSMETLETDGQQLNVLSEDTSMSEPTTLTHQHTPPPFGQWTYYSLDTVDDDISSIRTSALSFLQQLRNQRITVPLAEVSNTEVTPIPPPPFRRRRISSNTHINTSQQHFLPNTEFLSPSQIQTHHQMQIPSPTHTPLHTHTTPHTQSNPHIPPSTSLPPHRNSQPHISTNNYSSSYTQSPYTASSHTASNYTPPSDNISSQATSQTRAFSPTSVTTREFSHSHVSISKKAPLNKPTNFFFNTRSTPISNLTMHITPLKILPPSDSTNSQSTVGTPHPDCDYITLHTPRFSNVQHANTFDADKYMNMHGILNCEQTSSELHHNIQSTQPLNNSIEHKPSEIESPHTETEKETNSLS